MVPYFATYFLILCAGGMAVFFFVAGLSCRLDQQHFRLDLGDFAIWLGRTWWVGFLMAHQRHVKAEVKTALAAERTQLEAAVDEAFPGELHFVQDEAEVERESLRSPTNL